MDSATISFSPITSKPRNPLARESLMASTFRDSNQDPPLLCWADDRLLSPVQQSFLTKHSVQHTPEISPTTSPSNTGSRSPSEKDFGRRSARRPPTGTDRNNFLSACDHANYLHKRRFSVEPIREDADAANDSSADGVYHYEDSAEVGLEGNLEIEIDGLLEELMDYHSKRRATMMSAPLLPLPEELSPTASPQLHPDSPLPPLVTANMLFGSDSDTPSLTPSSPRSSKGSHFALTRSPSLKSKKSTTPITPSTDGWRSPASLTTVPEHNTPSFDYFGHTRLSEHSEAWPSDPRETPENISRDSCTSSEPWRAHHTNLPPIRTTIPEDSTIQRRAKGSISSENTITGNDRSRTESPANQSLSSRFSDDSASEITEIGYIDPGFDHVYPSNSSAVSIRFAQPGVDSLRGQGLSAFDGRYSPTSSISPGFVDYPPPTDIRRGPSPKRGMLQSLFSQASSSGQKERKRTKGRDLAKPGSQSMENMSFATASSKSSKDKGKKRSDKAEKRAQLAAQLKDKELQHVAEGDRWAPPPVAASRKAAWEECGAMYSMDGIF